MAGGKCPMGHTELCNDKCEWHMEKEDTCCIKVKAVSGKPKPKRKGGN